MNIAVKCIASMVLVFYLIVISVLLVPVTVQAQQSNEPCQPRQSILGLPTWYKYLNSETDSSGRCSPKIENTAAALPIGVAVLEFMLRLAGVVAVAMIFVGAFKFITSQGNGDAAAGARKTVINAIIGLVIVILSTGIVAYIGSELVSL